MKVCTGYITNGKADINVSDIFSFLIKEVGTKVTHYASDLYYDLKAIDKAIEQCKSDSFLIGLRDTGVDGKTFIEIKEKHPDVYGNPYIVIYSVDVIVTENEITVVLKERR